MIKKLKQLDFQKRYRELLNILTEKIKSKQSLKASERDRLVNEILGVLEAIKKAPWGEDKIRYIENIIILQSSVNWILNSKYYYG